MDWVFQCQLSKNHRRGELGSSGDGQFICTIVYRERRQSREHVISKRTRRVKGQNSKGPCAPSLGHYARDQTTSILQFLRNCISNQIKSVFPPSPPPPQLQLQLISKQRNEFRGRWRPRDLCSVWGEIVVCFQSLSFVQNNQIWRNGLMLVGAMMKRRPEIVLKTDYFPVPQTYSNRLVFQLIR